MERDCEVKDEKIKSIPIREIVKGYANDDEEGIVGFDGKLNIRPKYQREFLYEGKRENAVIETIMKGLPLGLLHWSVNEDGTYEILDGQQRILSVCRYVAGKFSIKLSSFPTYFENLHTDTREHFLNYEMLVYKFKGNETEKRDWFETINTGGLVLTTQELRNAICTGTWLTDAKRHFSKTGCQAYNIASEYMKGSPIRQDYLETAIDWISGGKIEEYMAKNQHEPNANEIWLYFQKVIDWVKVIFPKNCKGIMKGVSWGFLYNDFKEGKFDTAKLGEEITKLMQDDDVTNKRGIYEYVLRRDEKYLNIRTFTPNQKREAYERRNGICPKCGKHFEIDEMEGDHITPWHEGGKTTGENCQMICKYCNRTKAGK
jgi:hypothetical protein